MRLAVIALGLSLAVSGCQSILGIGETQVGGTNDAGADPDAPVSGDSGPGGDGGSACVAGDSQCDNCIDDDGDGKVDGADPHCTTLADDDEGSFSTGIPGDNIDSNSLDCFFDGDSGSGVDGCDAHPCCSLGAANQAECPLNPGTYDPSMCDLGQQCIDACAQTAVPGCDCLGCCTVCDETGTCRDVQVHPVVSPDCFDNIADEQACLACVKDTTCESLCDPNTCILCPGMTLDDLPPQCAGENQCPDNAPMRCEHNSDCNPNEFCGAGCCVPQF